MSRRLARPIALWFIVQIVLPFTAPLQTLDLKDLFGGTAPLSAQTSPESSTTPTLKETATTTGLATLAVLLAFDVLPVATPEPIEHASLTSRHRQPPTLSPQRSVLRL